MPCSDIFCEAFDGLCWSDVRQKAAEWGATAKGDGKAQLITLEWTRAHDAFIAALCLLTSSVCIATACLNVCKDSVAPCINIALYKNNAAKNIFLTQIIYRNYLGFVRLLVRLFVFY